LFLISLNSYKLKGKHCIIFFFLLPFLAIGQLNTDDFLNNLEDISDFSQELSGEFMLEEFNYISENICEYKQKLTQANNEDTESIKTDLNDLRTQLSDISQDILSDINNNGNELQNLLDENNQLYFKISETKKENTAILTKRSLEYFDYIELQNNRVLQFGIDCSAYFDSLVSYIKLDTCQRKGFLIKPQTFEKNNEYPDIEAVDAFNKQLRDYQYALKSFKIDTFSIVQAVYEDSFYAMRDKKTQKLGAYQIGFTQQNNKWKGFHKLLIPIIYDGVVIYNYSVAIVELNGKFGIFQLDNNKYDSKVSKTNLETSVELKYEDFEIIFRNTNDGFTHKYLLLKKDGNWGKAFKNNFIYDKKEDVPL
jgi:hypothetical protein